MCCIFILDNFTSYGWQLYWCRFSNKLKTPETIQKSSWKRTGFPKTYTVLIGLIILHIILIAPFPGSVASLRLINYIYAVNLWRPYSHDVSLTGRSRFYTSLYYFVVCTDAVDGLQHRRGQAWFRKNSIVSESRRYQVREGAE